MTEYKFQPEYAAQVFINANGGITITQDDAGGREDMVVFSSKSRAVEVAKSILALSKLASFSPLPGDEQ